MNRASENQRLPPRHAGTPGFGIWKWRPADDAFDADPRCRKLLRLPSDGAAVAADWLARLAPEWRDRFDIEWMAHLNGLTQELDFIFACEGQSDEMQWLRAMGVAERGPEGEPSCVRGIIVQMTEQCNREFECKAAEARFRALIETSPDAIAVHRDGRIHYANPAAARVLGRSVEDLVGALFLALTPQDTRGALAQALRPRADGRFTELELGGPDGRRIIVEVTSNTLPYEGAPAICTVFRDITARKQTEERLVLAERMATVGRLAAGVAHEINNPLMYVMLAVQGLLEDMPALEGRINRLRARLGGLLGDEFARALWHDLELPDDSHPFGDVVTRLQEAEHGTGRVRDIVQDLRTFSRPDAGPPRAVGPHEVVDAAVQMTEHLLRHRATVSVEVDESAVALAHAGRLTQVLVNLLVNAADALDGGTPETHAVRLGCGWRGGEVCFTVSDNGRGIPEAVRAHIFEPFFTTKAPGKGTGLGLAVCDGLVRTYGGRIEVESVLGRGTTFHVFLPPATPFEASTELPMPSAPGETPMPSAPVETPPARTQVRLLVIDDEVLMGRALTRALRVEAQVVVVTGGADAVALLDHDRRFDLILCDMMMPGINGMQVYAWVAAHATELLRRIVFITGDVTTDEGRNFLASISNRCLVKPIPLDILRSLVTESTRSSMAPAPAPAPALVAERRRTPRWPASGVSGLLTLGDHLVPVTIVDWSATGFRAHALTPSPECRPGDTAEVVLRRLGDRRAVQAGVTVRRLQGTRDALDLGVEIADMDMETRSTFTGWLGGPLATA